MIRTKKHTVIPDSQFVIPDSQFVIPESQFVIPESQFVIPDLIRDPVLHHHWIAGQARNDKGTRNDNAVSVVVGRCHEFRKHR